MALHFCSLTHKMTCGLIMQATGYYRFDLNVLSEFNKMNTAPDREPTTPQSAVCVSFSYLNIGQTFRKTISFYSKLSF